jgi:hypothetical protein
MNTPGRNDGIMQGWFDGELVLDHRNVRFWDTNAFAINGFYFSTFLSGVDADWAATKQGSRSRLLVPPRRWLVQRDPADHDLPGIQGQEAEGLVVPDHLEIEGARNGDVANQSALRIQDLPLAKLGFPRSLTGKSGEGVYMGELLVVQAHPEVTGLAEQQPVEVG